MHGSVRIVNREIPRAASLPNSTMIGVGITPEGIHQNYVVYELALDKAWHYKQINQRRWIMHYAQARYGFNSSEIEHAWRLLLKSVYAFKGQQNMRGKYTICRRPTLKWSPWTWYDYELVRKALGHFIAAVENEENENSLSSNQLFKRDLVDVTRQFLQNQADLLFLNITKAYMNQNVKRFSSYTSKFLELLTDLDSILATHGDFLLGRFIERAKTVAGDDEDELRQFEFNALNQITLWGPTGQILDYATKQWSGIVMDYYLPRWQLFFDQLKYSLEQRVAFNQGKFARDVFEQVELPFNLNRKVYPTEPKGEFRVLFSHINSIALFLSFCLPAGKFNIYRFVSFFTLSFHFSLSRLYLPLTSSSLVTVLWPEKKKLHAQSRKFTRCGGSALPQMVKYRKNKIVKKLSHSHFSM